MLWLIRDLTREYSNRWARKEECRTNRSADTAPSSSEWKKSPTLIPNEDFDQFEYLASGGMGDVWVARDKRLNRTVAIKISKYSSEKHSVARNQFQREAEITGKLEHPGIAPIFTTGSTSDNQDFYAMRFVDGSLLTVAVQQFHKEAESIDLSQPSINQKFRNLLQHFVQVCKVIAFAHDQGIVHCDIKPSNIRLGKYGEVIVLDWGLAQDLAFVSVEAQSAPKLQLLWHPSVHEP